VKKREQHFSTGIRFEVKRPMEATSLLLLHVQCVVKEVLKMT